MADSTTNLDQILSTQAGKEITANALFDAASPSTFGGRHASTSSLLTWGYYGGKFNVSGTITNIANGTLSLTASTTNYVEVDSSGGFHVNTSGFTTGRFPLYTIVTGATAVTSYTDERLSAVGNTGGGGMSNPMTTAGDIIIGGSSGTPQRLGIGTTNYVLTVVSGAPAWAAASGGGSNSGPPTNTQTGTSYHPVLADVPQSACYEGIITMNNAAANTVTIDPHSTTAWVAGTCIVLTQLGAGQSAFAAGSGVTLNTPSSLTCRAQYSTIFAQNIGTDNWIIGGDMS